jgi:hypothetical protein
MLQREMMASPEFETAVLTYLLNTGGGCWKDDQEKKRELFNVELKKAKAVKGLPLPSRDKDDRHNTRCTWAADKSAALATLKLTNKDRYNIARSKMELFTSPSLPAAYEAAKKILDADEPYKRKERDYLVVAVGEGLAVPDVAAGDPFGDFF